MPNPTSKPSSKRPFEESNPRLSQKSMSSQCRAFPATSGQGQLHHLHHLHQHHHESTAPPLRHFKMEPSELPSSQEGSVQRHPKLTKLLVKVTIQGSVGPVQLLMSPESTVEDLIAASMKQYEKEARRPALPFSGGFDLHYSQFSLQRLERGEKLANLGSRTFFLCKGRSADEAVKGAGEGHHNGRLKSCSKEAEKGAAKVGFPWLKFLNL